MVIAKPTLENRHKPAPVLGLLSFAKTGHSNRVCIEHTLLQTQTLFTGLGLSGSGGYCNRASAPWIFLFGKSTVEAWLPGYGFFINYHVEKGVKGKPVY